MFSPLRGIHKDHNFYIHALNLYNTVFSEPISNVNNSFHCLQGVFQQLLFASQNFFGSFVWFSTCHKLDRVWQFFVVCWKSCGRIAMLLWCKYNTWQLLKNRLHAVNNAVYITDCRWLKSQCLTLHYWCHRIFKFWTKYGKMIRKTGNTFQQ